MKVLLIYNSYEAQAPKTLRRIKDSLLSHSDNCDHARGDCVKYDVAVAMSSTEKHPPSKYPIISINHDSPHRRWFLSFFSGFDIADSYDWYAILDGDTHLFMKVLNERLMTMYLKPQENVWYVGGTSECHTSFLNNGIFPYGGGGVFISNKAAKMLYKRKDYCLQKFEYIFGGDELLYRCFQEIGVLHTIDNAFHQMDFIGDVTGIFETLFPTTGIVSLHHLNQVYLGTQPLYKAIPLLTKASDIIGAEHFGKRSLVAAKCEENTEKVINLSITHGVSIVQYDEKLTKIPGNEMFNPNTVVKTHSYWGDRDHLDPRIYGKQLVSESGAIMRREYLQNIDFRSNAKEFVETFGLCSVTMNISSSNMVVTCKFEDCTYSSSFAATKEVSSETAISSLRKGSTYGVFTQTGTLPSIESMSTAATKYWKENAAFLLIAFIVGVVVGKIWSSNSLPTNESSRRKATKV